MMQRCETITCTEASPGVMVLSFNRPASANALNTQMATEIAAFFNAVEFDTGGLRCIVLTGSGERAFCAGGDLKERNGMSDIAWRAQHLVFQHAYYALMDCRLPVIAAVNGAAYGGGCEFALACDFIYAARTARFALTETSLGIIPGGGGTQTLSRAVGTRRAKELILTASPFSSEEALRWGVVNEICEPDVLMPCVIRVAEHIAANAPIAVQQAKRAITMGAEIDLKTALAFEIEAYNRTVGTTDRREGVAAFGERRKPKFSGQ